MWADIIAVGVQSKNRQLKKWSGSHPLCIATHSHPPRPRIWGRHRDPPSFQRTGHQNGVGGWRGGAMWQCGFEFAEIFIFEKRLSVSVIRGVANSPYPWVGESTTPRITDIHGVGNSPHHWYAESATPRITDMESRLLNFFKRKLSVSMIRRVVDSHTSDTVSRRLPVSLSRRVADFACHRYGESTTPHIIESGSRRLRVSVIRGVAIQKKNWFSFDFQYSKWLKDAFKGSIWPKISQGCIVLSQ